MTSARAVWLLASLNFLNYLDRYLLAALLPAIQVDLGLSDLQVGLLGSLFVYGYLLASPVFAWWAFRHARRVLMGISLVIWSVATMASGLAHSFYTQALTRFLVGWGEAGYAVLSPAALADWVPLERRARAFAIYSGAIPVGSACGFLLAALLEPLIGWAWSFVVVGAPGLLALSWVLRLPDTRLDAQASQAPLGDASDRLGVIKRLVSQRSFVLTVLGYAAQTFVIGGLAHWLPIYTIRTFQVSLTEANLAVGGITVIGGVLGTLMGGRLADRIEASRGNGHMSVAVLAALGSAPLLALTLQQSDWYLFLAFLLLAEVILFMCFSPLDAALMTIVPVASRPMAGALNLFTIHVLGDGFSRTWIGYQSQVVGLQSALQVMPWVLLFAALFWLLNWLFEPRFALWPETSPRPRSRQGHRGAWRTLAEQNTVSAILRSESEGVEQVEIDIQVSQDGVAILAHDSRIGAQRLDEMSASSIQAHGFQRLDELFAALEETNSKLLLNIELKVPRGQAPRRVVDALVRAVNGQGERLSRRLMVSSFSPRALRQMARVAPWIPRGLLVGRQARRPWLEDFLISGLSIWFTRAHALHVEAGPLAERVVRRHQRQDSIIVVWTVNGETEIQSWLNRGAQSVISDRP